MSEKGSENVPKAQIESRLLPTVSTPSTKPKVELKLDPEVLSGLSSLEMSIASGGRYRFRPSEARLIKRLSSLQSGSSIKRDSEELDSIERALAERGLTVELESTYALPASQELRAELERELQKANRPYRLDKGGIVIRMPHSDRDPDTLRLREILMGFRGELVRTKEEIVITTKEDQQAMVEHPSEKKQSEL